MTTNNNNNTIPSIYIHRAHIRCDNPNLFRDTFNRVLGVDCVRTVDLVKKTDKNDIPFIRAFIHFKFWPRGETAHRMYNDLMTDKRLEITYNQDTKWFWRFCRSKITAPNKRKSNTGEKKTIKSNTGDVCEYPILKRTETTGYKETSQPNVSNMLSWWMSDKKAAMFSEMDCMSDDGEDFMSDDGEDWGDHGFDCRCMKCRDI